MLEVLPDYDPRALQGFAVSAERRGDLNAARIYRACSAEIERLRGLSGQKTPKSVTLTEIEREFISDMSDENPPPEEAWRNFDPDYRQIDIARMLRKGWFERKNEGDYRSYRWTAAGREALTNPDPKPLTVRD